MTPEIKRLRVSFVNGPSMGEAYAIIPQMVCDALPSLLDVAEAGIRARDALREMPCTLPSMPAGEECIDFPDGEQCERCSGLYELQAALAKLGVG